MGRESKYIDVGAVTIHDAITAISKTASGSGYVANEIITLSGGSGTPAKIKVLTVTAGAIATFEINDPGTGYAIGDNLTQASTTGSGTGATFTVDAIEIITSDMIEIDNPMGCFIGASVIGGSGQSYVVFGGADKDHGFVLGLGTPNAPFTQSFQGVSLPACPKYIWLWVVSGTNVVLRLSVS